MTRKAIHTTTLFIGLVALIASLYMAVIIANPHFYTLFALGTWLVLDWVDYHLTGYSTLGYFLRKRSWDAFVMFFLLAGLLCFIIDIVYGVHITQLWTWSDYGVAEYLRMILIMNISFLFSVVELFRIIEHLLGKVIPDKNLLHYRLRERTRRVIYTLFIAISILSFVITPIAAVNDSHVEYFMFLPFLAMFLVTDSITYFSGGSPYTEKILKANGLFILSFIFSWLVLAPVTELVNLYAGEWEYLRMPFEQITVFGGIPLAVFLGWVPLMLGAISTIHMVKHLNYLQDHR